MKIMICLFVVLLCTLKIEAQDYAVISGIVEEKGLNRICLYRVVDGTTVECDKYPGSSMCPNMKVFMPLVMPRKRICFT